MEGTSGKESFQAGKNEFGQVVIREITDPP
jgi:hypothetical protein